MSGQPMASNTVGSLFNHLSKSMTDPMLDHLFFLSINIYWALTVYKALNYIAYWYVLVGKVDTASSLMKFTIIWEWEEDRH